MTTQNLFCIFIILLVLDASFEYFLEFLNFSNRKKSLPKLIKSLFSEDSIQKQRNYQKDNFKFGMWTGIPLQIITILIIAFQILPQIDKFLRFHIESEFWISASFFGIILIANQVVSIPLSAYSTFVIEERHGFNKSSLKTFILDIVKSSILGLILFSLIFSLIFWFYSYAGNMFWLYTWAFLTAFSLFMSLFYSQLIVPLFNKQTALEEGDLKNSIADFCQKVGFKLKDIYIIDSSKRSSKTNAYFTGFGSKKRIVLYDNMLEKHTNDEILAVLAHEIGHYKKHHIIIDLFTSIFTSGIQLFLLGLLMNHPQLSRLLGNEVSSFHFSLITFGLLFSFLGWILAPLSSNLSRKHEYEADKFAADNNLGKELKEALIKLNGDNLSNFNPHKLYVFFHYSHPTLIQRITRIDQTIGK